MLFFVFIIKVLIVWYLKIVMKIVILGASKKRERFSNKAVRAYLKKGYEVFPVNPNYDEIEGIKVYHSLSELPVDKVDIVSVYVNPSIGITMIDEIIRLKPKRVMLNPGSESKEIIDRLRKAKVDVVVGCSILSLGEDPNNY